MPTKSTPIFNFFCGRAVPGNNGAGTPEIYPAPPGVTRCGGAAVSERFPSRNFPVKPRIFAQTFLRSDNYEGRKSGEFAAVCRNFLCKSKSYEIPARSLWKTPVEKSVENVENSLFSTGIPPLSRRASPCG